MCYVNNVRKPFIYIIIALQMCVHNSDSRKNIVLCSDTIDPGQKAPTKKI